MTLMFHFRRYRNLNITFKIIKIKILKITTYKKKNAYIACSSPNRSRGIVSLQSSIACSSLSLYVSTTSPSSLFIHASSVSLWWECGRWSLSAWPFSWAPPRGLVTGMWAPSSATHSPTICWSIETMPSARRNGLLHLRSLRPGCQFISRLRNGRWIRDSEMWGCCVLSILYIRFLIHNHARLFIWHTHTYEYSFNII